jgi:ribonuclease D
MESGVAVELIATQAELASLVGSLRRGEGTNHVRVAQGWRGELVGDELKELVEGRRALSVDPKGGLRVSPT